MTEEAGSSALSELGRMVRRHDRDRFLTTLFAPAAERQALLALYAFNHEVAKTREVVSEPMLGRIRLQWWRDSLDQIYAGAPARRHEVVGPLAAAIERRALTRGHFDALIDARERDLEDAPPESLATLEAYAESSSAPLVLLALEALGERSDARDQRRRIGELVERNDEAVEIIMIVFGFGIVPRRAIGDVVFSCDPKPKQ